MGYRGQILNTQYGERRHMIPEQTELDPQDTLTAILSPLAKALDDHNLTLDRLCKDLDTVIKTTADEPGHKLKGIDMAIKLNQAYPAEQHDLTVSPGGVADALMVRIAANVRALPALTQLSPDPATPGRFIPRPDPDQASPGSAETRNSKGRKGSLHGAEGAGV